ncbi:type I polyketide synthase [Mycobacterium sp.]|uniref:type I polyketide synthase n=1 Tax=Mycobacterium sp. TaxID=1785 RepID=UPI003BAB6507
MTNDGYGDSAVAVIGMACRFPGAESVGQFWDQSLSGTVASREVTKDEFSRVLGDSHDEAWDNPNLVKTCFPVAAFDRFDHEFFGYTPYEAAILDPQQRVLLEVAYQALEASGHIRDRSRTPISVYASVADSRYLSSFLYPKFGGGPGTVELMHASTANSVGTAAPRVSYHLGLTGTSLSVHTACSSSLVAIHLACQDLLEYNSDTALVGACSINPTVFAGYVYIPGGPFSPDGICRPYDAKANGTAPGDGAAAVVLKRLEDAIRDSDHIHAVIRGSSVNNDARRKVGFSAPSVAGQHEVIDNALASAGVMAETVGYIEGHGSATALGDSIEVAALTQAYGESTGRRNICGLGSVKGNIGHLSVASGIAGFIRATLAVERGLIPATANFEAENPELRLGDSPFWVSKDSMAWNCPGAHGRRAGVSSLGIGGTNAHLILEQFRPEEDVVSPGIPVAHGEPAWEVIPVSAHTADSLRNNLRALADYLKQREHASLSDVAAYVRSHREQFRYRSAVVADSREGAAAALADQSRRGVLPLAADGVKVCFAFPGGGSQYPGMGRELYRSIEPFRASVDECVRLLGDDGAKIRDSFLRDTEMLQSEGLVALAVVEYSLAQTLIAHGIEPTVMVGHSLGEYVAACLAGALRLEDMLYLLAERCRLLDRVPGVSVSVPLAEEDILPHLTAGVSLAAVNTPSSCLVSGDEASVAALERKLLIKGVQSRRIALTIAPHSHLLDNHLHVFRDAAATVAPREPARPYVSMLEGRWAGSEQRIDAEYWVRHLRSTVRFAQGAHTLFGTGGAAKPDLIPDVVVEIGPGDTLVKFLRASVGEQAQFADVQTMRKAKGSNPDTRMLLASLAALWEQGAADMPPRAAVPRNRLGGDYPRYAFDRVKAWVGDGTRTARARQAEEERVYDANKAFHEHDLGEREFERLAAEYRVDVSRREEYRVVYDLWKKRLGNMRASVTGNFFDLGGDSMQAALLAAEICEKTKFSMTAQAVIENPTLRGLIGFLVERPGEDGCAEKFPVLLSLRQDGDRPPLFCFHPGSGISWAYLKLLKFFEEGQPVYALQSTGLDERSYVAHSFDAMVQQYIGLISSVWPSGPYRLFGWSYGGVVAHAVAEKLLRAGEDVDFVIMADSPAPATFPTDEEAVVGIVESFMGRLLDAQDPAADVTALLSYDDLTRIRNVVRNNILVVSQYRPARLDCEVHFIDAMRADETDSDCVDPSGLPDKSAAWQEYCAHELLVHGVDSDHHTMLEGDSLNAVGAILQDVLAGGDRVVAAAADRAAGSR